MKIGDYVAKVTNEWQRHNKWMDFEEEVEPLGIIVGKTVNGASWFWDVLLANGKIQSLNEAYLKVVYES